MLAATPYQLGREKMIRLQLSHSCSSVLVYEKTTRYKLLWCFSFTNLADGGVRSPACGGVDRGQNPAGNGRRSLKHVPALHSLRPLDWSGLYGFEALSGIVLGHGPINVSGTFCFASLPALRHSPVRLGRLGTYSYLTSFTPHTARALSVATPSCTAHAPPLARSPHPIFRPSPPQKSLQGEDFSSGRSYCA
jgi:hypothetical protein